MASSLARPALKLFDDGKTQEAFLSRLAYKFLASVRAAR
jgi:hypothetical protein